MTESDWLKQIEADPRDAVTQLAFADWLRERGEDRLADAWAWMARRGKYAGWLTWYNVAVYGDNDPNDLPEEVFGALPCGDAVDLANEAWARFDTVAKAVAALAVALEKAGVNA